MLLSAIGAGSELATPQLETGVWASISPAMRTPPREHKAPAETKAKRLKNLAGLKRWACRNAQHCLAQQRHRRGAVAQ